jgi:acyl transferase domain-containing protein
MGVRVAQAVGATGPTFVMDAGCASAGIAVCTAADLLHAGRCDTVLVGGVFIGFETTRLLQQGIGDIAPSGIGRYFGDNPDGGTPSEGAGVLILKRLRDAERAGDRIHAIVTGTSVGFAAKAFPGFDRQQRIERIMRAYGRSSPYDVQYAELMGAGVLAIDALELEVFHEIHKDRTTRLPVGTARTAVGNTYAANGIASIAKIIASFRESTICPHPADEPTHLFNWADTKLYLPPKAEPWPAGTPKVASVEMRAFGENGAHIVLRAASAGHAWAASPRFGKTPICISAACPAAFRARAGQLVDVLRDGSHRLEDVAFTLACRRKHLACRRVVWVRSREEAIEALEQLSVRGASAGLHGAITIAFEDRAYPPLAARARPHELLPFGAALDALATGPMRELSQSQREALWLARTLSRLLVTDVFVPRYFVPYVVMDPSRDEVLPPVPSDAPLDLVVKSGTNTLDIRPRRGTETLFEALTAAFERGASVAWQDTFEGEAFVELPRYPWQRKRFWPWTAQE